MRHSLHAVQAQGADEIAVHSFESGIYLVEATVNGDTGYITNGNGENAKFNSVQEVKEAFKHSKIPTKYLVEETAYDEMCGSSESHNAPMRIPL